MAYKKSASCPHASLEVAGRPLTDGRAAAPFFFFMGEKAPFDAEPIQFFGQVTQDITWQGVDDEGHHVALLEIVHFVMTANDPHFGTLTIVHDNTRPGGFGTLRSVEPGKEFPVVHVTRLHVTALSDAMPGVVLQNRGFPLEFVGEPSDTWPPENVVYSLTTAVRFENRSKPAAVMATATAGSVVIGVDARIR